MLRPPVPALLLAALVPALAGAVQLDALDMSRDWRLAELRFHGNAALRTSELRAALVTRPRLWFALWRRLPIFDPVAFHADLGRLHRLYESRGYYDADITHDIELPAGNGDTVTVTIWVAEGRPITVARVDVELAGAELAASERRLLLDHLPLVRDQAFREDTYDQALVYLRSSYREHGFARVAVTKRCRVDRVARTAEVDYRVDSGPPCVFGDVQISGVTAVEPAIVRRELTFAPGDPFSQSRLDRTRERLVGLGLFRAVRLDESPAGERVDVRLRVTEAPRREVRLGVGYDTEEQVRGLASWRDYDFLGGARQLGFSARLSFLNRTLAADFLQPHFPGADNRTRLLAAEQREEEDTYRLDRTRVSPRLEWQATPAVTGFAFYRVEYDSLANVKKAVRDRPGLAPPNAFLSGVGLGADWNRTDNLLDPTRGWLASATVEPVGGALGGQFAFVRLIGEGRCYQPLPGGFLGAARLRLGASNPFSRADEVPLYERFYAGGINSVRGYDRRRVGPLLHDQPIGGRTLVETSLELRHPLTEHVDGAVFVDAGQVSIKSFNFPFGELRYGSGIGLRYRSPVGPLRVDLGFPVEPPSGDSRWQVHLSAGATF
jgi:outer membrane protein assembly complex protein YaeT